jgi:hypothetical protein
VEVPAQDTTVAVMPGTEARTEMHVAGPTSSGGPKPSTFSCRSTIVPSVSSRAWCSILAGSRCRSNASWVFSRGGRESFSDYFTCFGRRFCTPRSPRASRYCSELRPSCWPCRSTPLIPRPHRRQVWLPQRFPRPAPHVLLLHPRPPCSPVRRRTGSGPPAPPSTVAPTRAATADTASLPRPGPSAVCHCLTCCYQVRSSPPSEVVGKLPLQDLEQRLGPRPWPGSAAPGPGARRRRRRRAVSAGCGP